MAITLDFKTWVYNGEMKLLIIKYLKKAKIKYIFFIISEIEAQDSAFLLVEKIGE